MFPAHGRLQGTPRFFIKFPRFGERFRSIREISAQQPDRTSCLVWTTPTVNQSINQPINQSTWIKQLNWNLFSLFSQPANKSINQSVEPINYWQANQSINQSINRWNFNINAVIGQSFFAGRSAVFPYCLRSFDRCPRTLILSKTLRPMVETTRRISRAAGMYYLFRLKYAVKIFLCFSSFLLFFFSVFLLFLLQAMNEIRVPFITDAYLAYGLQGDTTSEQRTRRNSPFPLQNAKILDVGCGGGILSEPLARLGGQVTGIDMVQDSIHAARQHWENVKPREVDRVVDDVQGSVHKVPRTMPGRLEYLHGTVEELALDKAEEFDLVVCSEVVEHVGDVAGLVEAIARLTRPGGVAVFSTINRTVSSYAAAILGAEYLLRLVPRGTHHHGKFVRPEELESFLRGRGGFDVRVKHGAVYNPVTRRWSWSAFDGVNYFMAAVKSGETVGEDVTDRWSNDLFFCLRFQPSWCRCCWMRGTFLVSLLLNERAFLVSLLLNESGWEWMRVDFDFFLQKS